jgi:hypothetical protein
VSGSGAVDVTCQAATLASELVAVAANSGVARRAAAFGDVGARRRRNGQAGKREGKGEGKLGGKKRYFGGIFGRRHDAESEALAGIWARGIPGVGREEKMRISLAKVNF